MRLIILLLLSCIGTAHAQPTPRSAPWTDFSATLTTTASTVVAASIGARIALHVWNNGTNLACLNYTTTAAFASATACSPGAIPLPAGAAYLEDQDGNVSQEAISMVCATGTCPVTVKVR